MRSEGVGEITVEKIDSDFFNNLSNDGIIILIWNYLRKVGHLFMLNPIYSLKS
jgi:hypothetical protein